MRRCHILNPVPSRGSAPSQGATDPATQLIAWTKYFCTFVLSLAIQLLSGRSNKSACSGSSRTTATNEPSSKADPVAVAATPAGGNKLRDANSRKAAWLTAAVG